MSFEAQAECGVVLLAVRPCLEGERLALAVRCEAVLAIVPPAQVLQVGVGENSSCWRSASYSMDTSGEYRHMQPEKSINWCEGR